MWYKDTAENQLCLQIIAQIPGQFETFRNV